jgi:glycerol-3-phosphate dehydrogenase
VWAGELVDDVRLRPSRGTHLVLRGASLPGLRLALMAPVPGAASRFVFALPQPSGRVYVGLTDEPADGPVPDVPEPTEDEIDFLLDVVSGAVDRRLGRDDVVGAFAGLRPLVDSGGSGSSADLSRRHAVLTSPDGVVTVVGGKLTTYRRMAQDTVDHLLGNDGRHCVTASLPLMGAATHDELRHVAAPSRLVRRYGTEAAQVAALAAGDRSLLEPIVDTLPVLGVELLFGAQHEGALTPDDLLDRRVRLGLVPAERRAAEAAAAGVMQTAAA